MKQDHKRDIDYYSIEEFEDGKFIHYSSFSYVYEPDDDDIPETAIMQHELTFCYIPISDYCKDGLDIAQERVQQYTTIIPFDLVKDDPGEYLPLKDVTEDTPCGDYWCYLEDE